MGIPSRGESLSAYSPSISKGAKVYGDNLKFQFITGAVSANIGAFALAHSLGVIPVAVVVGQRGISAKLSAAAYSVAQSSVSANTSTIIYLAAGESGAKFSLIALA